jgi:hypothetical protein
MIVIAAIRIFNAAIRIVNAAIRVVTAAWIWLPSQLLRRVVS